MKRPTRPISSPNRTDKFPPPLMRFLKKNAGSRSRGRSRSTTTMFFRKKNTNIETQEPSSPKVTCMGQVRVKRSSTIRVSSSAAALGATTKCWCCSWSWVPRALFFHRFSIKPGFCCKPVWPNWGFSGRNKRDSKVTTEASSPKTELNFRERGEPSYHENTVKPASFVSNTSTTPPRNALLLTRCRSAPGRRFEIEVENREHCENNREEKLRLFKEVEESVRKRIMESEKEREEESESVHPLVLTRCKSEPARTAQKLHPPLHGFTKKTTLWFAPPYYSHAA